MSEGTTPQDQQPVVPVTPATAQVPSADPDERPLDPEKLLRLASLAREVLEESRKMDPDQSTVSELANLHSRVTGQLYGALPKNLVEELEAIDLDLAFDSEVSGQEVRIAYSGLIGWLSGLFQGLQAAMHYQTMARLTDQRQLAPGQEEEKEKDEPPGRYL